MKRPRIPMSGDLWRAIAEVFWTSDVDGVRPDRESAPDAYDDLIREAAVRLDAGHDPVEIARAILAKVAATREQPTYSAAEIARLAGELSDAMARVSTAPDMSQTHDWILDLSQPPPDAQPDDGIETVDRVLAGHPLVTFG